ncbi:MAG: porphobilinogen synthase [Nitrososphaeraceae archaeon]|jgi:porphobilinogen synthase|nr:porphobilinogen synthase [Nitrososphaeraceae archaeon]MDW0173230.1 porphobilinogen synthase [Nitrososphaeraceae archaeon]MDW0175650.1 porphobilinogen synthase [Nitrososphaeraceae archaeon]MDW0178235.1 porphobilinogen synthase [Nitrososphaeraceae archaeon]MDW0179462.1 porphobilinogen synthase [Nitrososphaeraceae archaeon]
MNQNEAPESDGFPKVRLRRLRRTPAIRDLLQETRLSVKDLVCPVFIQEGIDEPKEIELMPGIFRVPLKNLDRNIQELYDLGLRTFLIFGIPKIKNDKATSAYSKDGIVQQSVKSLKQNFGEKIVTITDVCLCQYTSHGHCGIIKNKVADNDTSLKVLDKVATSHAEAGVDFVAPSAMMDGQVKSIRNALDNANFINVGIIGYSAKLSSNLYTPFRDASHSTPEFGDRKTYQMPFHNTNEALQEIMMDVREGADIVMIKPALPYLDLIYKTRQSTLLPVCAYSVSGEYSIVKAAAMEGWVNEDELVMEFMTSIKRAGADIIVSYYAKRVGELLNSI